MESESTAEIIERAFSIKNKVDFDLLAADVFRFQYDKNTVYRRFSDLTGFQLQNKSDFPNFPFLPVSFFGTHLISSNAGNANFIFKSSGTSGQLRSQHHIYDPEVYKNSIINGFKHFFGNIKDYCILGLIPRLNDMPDSSLAFMFEVLREQSGHPYSLAYFCNEHQLNEVLNNLPKDRKVLLFGISWALLDFGEKYGPFSGEFEIIETGGMKGRKKEITREELQCKLNTIYGKRKIRSEYSMCEIFSQAWSDERGVFSCPPWMKVIIRDLFDPLSDAETGRSGRICIADLANIHTCSFIATQDLGREISPGCFEVIGRIDHSDLRGCSLLIDIS